MLAFVRYKDKRRRPNGRRLRVGGSAVGHDLTEIDGYLTGEVNLLAGGLEDLTCRGGYGEGDRSTRFGQYYEGEATVGFDPRVAAEEEDPKVLTGAGLGAGLLGHDDLQLSGHQPGLRSASKDLRLGRLVAGEEHEDGSEEPDDRSKVHPLFLSGGEGVSAI